MSERVIESTSSPGSFLYLEKEPWLVTIGHVFVNQSMTCQRYRAYGKLGTLNNTIIMNLLTLKLIKI